MAERFTITQLARATRTSVATIKFYRREGVLPPPNLEAKHRAFYDGSHVTRLELVVTLRTVGGLGMRAIRDICRALDAPSVPISEMIVRTIDALGHSRRAPATARRDVLRVLAAHHVRVRDDAKAIDDLAHALVALRRVVGEETSAEVFVPYLIAMRALAARDLSENAHLVTDKSSGAYGATLATVLWEPILLALRRIAHEDACARTFGKP